MPNTRIVAGGMVAAPTHGPNAVTTKKQVCWVYGCGPHACGPYKPGKTQCKPYPADRRVVSHRKQNFLAA